MVKQIIKLYQPQKLSWPKDWFIKIISVLLAFLLWYFVAGEDRVDMNVQVPVEIVNIPRDLVISNQYKTQLEVTVSGPRGLIKKISQENISRSIDLSNASPGNIVINNLPDSISFPRGIETLRINPRQIVLLVDRLTKKTIPIEPISEGKPSSDYKLESISLDPDTLIISGPQEILKNTLVLQTKPIDLSGVSKSFVKQVSLDLLPEVANLIGESIVTARVLITDKLSSKKVSRVPVSVHGISENQKEKLAPSKVTIKAQIPKAMLKSKEKSTTFFDAFVDVSLLPDGIHDIEVEVKSSPRITIEDIIPSSIKVTIETEVDEKPAE